ncbi:hypothetical protein AUK22_07985 [bacterium CG2_30_54_10]|nr:MAG: hypothetical protein AUK22_07985 [bacterium CG2_30_54_10]
MRKSWFLAFLGTFITVVLTIGCGGGGGGGGGANPVGPIAAGDFSDLSGTVVFDGKPLANANIYLYSSDGALAAGIGQLSSANNSVREAIIGNLAPGQLHTSSGLDGRYLFSHVPVGVYTLIAVKDATHQFARTGVVVGAITEVPVEITPTGTISGSIAISGRTSLGGGGVYLQGTSYVALSDDSGNFTIFNVPANTSFSLRASLANFSLSTPLSVQVTPGVTSNVGALVLTVASIPGTGNISGTVTRTGDTTQAGTLVLLRKSTGEAVTVTLTDSSGTYQLFGVASGNYQLEFTADNYLIPTPVAVAVISGQTISAAAVTMSSKVVPVVIGNFTGAASKTQLLSGESDNRGINLLLVNNSGSFLVTTDNAGAFAFNVPQGIYRFLALAPFQVVSGPATVINSSASVSVPGTPPTPNFVVSPVTPVAVPTAKFDFTGVATKATRLNDENDDSGMTLLMDGGASLGVFSATTKSDGSFEFRGIPGGSYNFSVVGRYQLVSGPISITLKGNLVGNYPAQPAVAPTPFLVFAGLATKTVKLADESDDGGMTLLLTGPGGPFTTTTQTNGMFRFVGLKPGTYNFSITGRYELVLPSGNNGSDTVTIVTANVNRDYNARPTVAPKPLFQFTGIATKTLKLADEIDDGGMTLLLKGPGGPHTTTTLQNGNFKFSDLQPGAYQFSITGRYRLQVPASDNGSDSVAIVAADVVRSYNAQPSVAPAFYFAFSGSILKSPALDDEFNQGGINLLLANSSGSYTTISDINGNFKFNSIPAGAYNLSVQGRYRLTNPGASDTIALAGDISTGTYAVQPLLPVVGTLNGTTSKNQKIFPGEDESGVTVEISSTTPHRLFSATTDAVGSFSIPAVPIGNYQIKIISSSYRADAGPTTVTVVSPVTNFPTVNLIPLSLYTGSVSATQSPVTPRLRYILTNSVSGSRFETVSDSSGNIRFENIPPTPGNNYNFIVDPASGYALSAAVPAFSLPSKANLALGGVNVVFVAPGIDSVVVTPGVKVSAFGNNIASGPGALTRGFADWKEMPATSTPWVAGQADFEIANLSPGTYALKLSNPDGTSTSSGSFFIDLATPSFDGTSATFNSVTANWIPVPFAESYVVQLDSGPIVKILATSYTFKNLTANTSFNFRVRAVGLGLKGPVTSSAITTGRYAFPNPLERAAPFTWDASGDVHRWLPGQPLGPGSSLHQVPRQRRNK